MIRSKTLIATPPGETIREQLEMWGMTQKEFSVRMDLSEKHISRLINGKVRLTDDVALRLETVLGVEASFWSNLENIYREKIARIEEENSIDEDTEFSKRLPVKAMLKNGWINDAKSKSAKVHILRQFYCVTRLHALETPGLYRIACRKLSDGEKSKYILLTFVQKARQEALAIETNKISIPSLAEKLNIIREMTRRDLHEFKDDLRTILAECGIALVILQNLAGSYLHGATFLDGKKIVVLLTSRCKFADVFWFSFFHELGHIINGDIFNQDGTTEQDEIQADYFSRETLIPDKRYREFLQLHDIRKDSIVNFANSIGIHPGIVVGRLQKDKIIQFNTLNFLKQKYSLLCNE